MNTCREEGERLY